MLLLLLMGLGQDTGPAHNYRTLPTEPAVALPYDAGRLSPWPSDFTSALPEAAFPAGGTAPRESDYSSGFKVAQTDSTRNAMKELFGEPEAADSETLRQLFGDPEEQVAEGATDLEQENMELRQRIDELEQLIKGVVSRPPVEAPQPSNANEDGTKSVPGWVAEVFDWNKSGRIGEDPLYTILTRSCAFNGTFAATSDSSLFIYRFQSTFRVKEAGRYVFAFDTTCGFDHQCTLQASVDGGKIIDFSGNMETGRLQNGIPLSVGDHTVEFITHQNKSSYLNYRPQSMYKWEPLIKGPSDLNPREFGTDELFVTIPATTKGVVQGCNY